MIYAVTLTYEIFVDAESEEAAAEIAEAAMSDHPEPDEIWLDGRLTIDEIPKVWRNCIPYTATMDDDRTIEERLAK